MDSHPGAEDLDVVTRFSKAVDDGDVSPELQPHPGLTEVYSMAVGLLPDGSVTEAAPISD